MSLCHVEDRIHLIFISYKSLNNKNTRISSFILSSFRVCLIEIPFLEYMYLSWKSSKEKNSSIKTLWFDFIKKKSQDNMKTNRSNRKIQDHLSALLSMLEDIEVLQRLTCRFRMRVIQTDPISGELRYGIKTMNRVMSLCHIHDFLTYLILILDSELSVITALKFIVHEQKKEFIQRQDIEKYPAIKYKKEKNQFAIGKLFHHRSTLSIFSYHSHLQVQKKRYSNPLHFPIPITTDNVKAKLNVLKNSTSPTQYLTSIRSLSTVCTQILSNPENEQYRTIRSNNPLFLCQIGNYEGGIGTLMSCGFVSVFKNYSKCYYLKEPYIKLDQCLSVNKSLDQKKWITWYNFLKEVNKVLVNNLKTVRK